MVIVGIVGRICSGKSTVSDLYRERQGIEAVRIEEFNWVFVFEKELYKQEELLEKWLDDERLRIKEVHSKNRESLQKSLLNFRVNQVVSPITKLQDIEFMKKRNYFHLLHVDAPLLLRYENFLNKHPQFRDRVRLEDFSRVDDYLFYNTELSACIERCRMKLVNKGTVQELADSISSNSCFGNLKFRPTFEQYFMKVAFILKTRSNCMKRSVGAVLVKENRILATGYNGTPKTLKNCFEGGCNRCNSNAVQGQDLSSCSCIHAEENCILEAGVHMAKGCDLYTTLFPCTWCAKVIIAAGIRNLYYAIDYDNQLSLEILKSSVEKIIKLETAPEVYFD